MDGYSIISTLIATILLIVVIYNLFRNFKKGMIAYYTLSLISPCFIIGNLNISFEIAAFFFVILFAIKSNGVKFHLGHGGALYANLFLISWFIYFLIVTLFSLFTNSSTRLLPIRLFGLFRFVFLTITLYSISKGRNEFFEDINKVYKWFLIINVPILLSQYIIPKTIYLYYTLFGKNTSAYLSEIKIGFYTRGYGTRSSPTILGVISVFVFAFYIGKYTYKKERYDVYYIAAAMIVGFLSGSKMFAFSLAIIAIVYLLLLPLYRGKKGIKQLILIIIFGFIISIVAVIILSKFNQLGRLLNYINNPMKTLSARYGNQGSIGSADRNIIKEKFLFGYGASIARNELLGDSLYYVILHDIGMFGTIVYLLIILNAFLIGFMQKDIVKVIFSILILAMGVGDPLYFTYNAIIPTYYILYISKN